MQHITSTAETNAVDTHSVMAWRRQATQYLIRSLTDSEGNNNNKLASIVAAVAVCSEISVVCYCRVLTNDLTSDLWWQLNMRHFVMSADSHWWSDWSTQVVMGSRIQSVHFSSFCPWSIWFYLFVFNWFIYLAYSCLQCFDAVGCVTGRTSSLSKVLLQFS